MAQVLKRKARTIYQKEHQLWTEKSMAPPQGQAACPSHQGPHPQQDLKAKGKEQSGLSDVAIFNKQDLQGQSPSFSLFSVMRTCSLPTPLSIGDSNIECTTKYQNVPPLFALTHNIWHKLMREDKKCILPSTRDVQPKIKTQQLQTCGNIDIIT